MFESTEPKPLTQTRHLVVVVAMTVICTLLILGLALGLFSFFFERKLRTGNPFANNSKPSVSFPLYYTTAPPPGFSADPKSVSEPQAGVVLYNLVDGPNKIVISEEARTSRMVNIGGFYQRFTDLKETQVSDGSIATGYYQSIRVASFTNNSTWIIASTTDNISFEQLTSMLKKLTIAL